MTSFESHVHKILTEHGYKVRSSKELVEWWSNFVSQCTEGYDWTIYEYDDEIGVREYLECLLQDNELQQFSEFAALRESVEKTDEIFRGLLQEQVVRPTDSKFWWRKGVLKFAGDEYRQDMASRYAILVAEY